MSTQSATLSSKDTSQEKFAVVPSAAKFDSNEQNSERLAISLSLNSLSQNVAKTIIGFVKHDVCLNDFIAAGHIAVSEKPITGSLTLTRDQIEEVMLKLLRPSVINIHNLAKLIVDNGFMKEIKSDKVYQDIFKQMIRDINGELKSGDSETAEKLLLLLKGDTHSDAAKINYFLENIPAKILVEDFLSYKEKIDSRVIFKLVAFDEKLKDKKFEQKVSDYINGLEPEQYIELCKKTHDGVIIEYYDSLYVDKPDVDDLILRYAALEAKKGQGKEFELILNHLKESSDAFQDYMVKGTKFREYFKQYFDNFNNYNGEEKNKAIMDIINFLRVLKGDLVDKLLYKELNENQKNASEVEQINSVFNEVFDIGNFNRNIKRNFEELIKELNDELIVLASANFKDKFNSAVSDYFTRKKITGIETLKFVIKYYVEKDNIELLKFLFNNKHNLGTNEEIGGELKKLVQQSKQINSYGKVLKVFSESASVLALSENDEYKKSFAESIEVMLYNNDINSLSIILKHLGFLLSQDHIKKIGEIATNSETLGDVITDKNQVAKIYVPSQDNVDIYLEKKDFECNPWHKHVEASESACRKELNTCKEELNLSVKKNNELNDQLNNQVSECKLSKVETELNVRKEVGSESSTTIYMQSDDNSYYNTFFDPVYTIGASVTATIFVTAAAVSKHMSGVDASLQRGAGFQQVKLIGGKLYYASMVSAGVSVVAGLVKYFVFSTTKDKMSKIDDVLKASTEKSKKSDDETISPITSSPDPQAMCMKENGEKGICDMPERFDDIISSSPTASTDDLSNTPAELQQGEQQHHDGNGE